jgi:subtilisin family serine protease
VTGDPFLGTQQVEVRSYGVGVIGPISTAVAAAIFDAVEDGVDVINLSLVLGYSPLVEEAIGAAVDAGIVVVAAAGNYGIGSGKKEVLFPANVDGVISVGSIDRRGNLSQFSARHGVDLLAPGEQVIIGGGNDIWYEGYGTSYATPHVTAAAAMLKAANPNLAAADVQEALARRATRRGNGGLGVVNAFASLNQVLPPDERAAFASTPLVCGVHAYLSDRLTDLGYGAGKSGHDGAWWDEFAYNAQADPDLYADLDRAAAELPAQIGLQGNYPNPFNPSTTIRFAVDRPQDVSVSVYNAIGQEVRVLYAGPVDAGSHDVSFDASGLPSGVYVTQLRTDSGTFTSKMILAK